ncbi:MAG: TonB-dependent receptor [Bryobacterales bacterium]|nr:TonB-dependent receptor [Bryobacterales bacterium]
MTRWTCACSMLLLVPANCWAAIAVSGRITNENNAPVGGAKVELRRETGGLVRAAAITDPAGEFQIELAEPGAYLLTVERKDYFPIPARPVEVAAEGTELHLTLNPVREVFQAVEVTAEPQPLETDQAASVERVTNTQLLEVPYPSTNNLKNALRILPSAVQDNAGRLHLNGGSEGQAHYVLDGFNIADPLTARFETRLSVEAVQSVELLSGAYPAEYGKGSAGTLVINTVTGDDKLRYNATNFIPGFENHKGWTLGNWEPRFNVSGPIRRGKAWFSDSTYLQYVNTVIDELPKGQDRTSSWRLSNLLHGQVNLAPSNILFASLLVNLWVAPNNGLGALTPLPTTADRRARQWFASVKDQIYFNGGALLEAGYASNRTFSRENPQGVGISEFTPYGQRGFSFVNARQTSSRDQFLANAFLPLLQLAGEHRLKAGFDIDLLNYWQNINRTGFEHFRANDTPARSVRFLGNGRLSRSMVETGIYAQDSWRVRPSVTIEAGLRTDRDDLLKNWNLSPRLGVAWAPGRSANTKLFGGYAVVYDATNLQLFTRPFDQTPATTYYNAEGLEQGSPSLLFYRVALPHYATPRATNINAGIEQRLPGGIFSRLNYLHRRGRRGFTYFNGADLAPEPDVNAVYDLGNHRVDRYHAFELTLRQPLRQQYEWMLSYRKSRATSNAVMDISLDDPLIVTDNAGPLDWDAPHRVMGWFYLPVPRTKSWAVASLFEYHSGFPFSIQDEYGRIQGAVNSMRFPVFAELNLHLEKKFRAMGYKWAWRFGFNNITNHRNYNVVNNNLQAPGFLRYYGGQSRAFNMRFRWLGRAAR